MKLFVCITDDEWGLLSHFLRHYAARGIEWFFIACPAPFEPVVRRYSAKYNITVMTDLDVDESIPAGSSAVTTMRERCQHPDEWVMIVDLDEFLEIDEPLDGIIGNLEQEGATVARAIMYDRFTGSGKLLGFTENDDLARVFPIKARLNQTVTNAIEHKGVLVRGRLKAAIAHHHFEGEIVSSRQFDLSHYRFHGRSLDRLRRNVQRVREAGEIWFSQYEDILRHYDQHGRFAWESFGGWRDDLLSTDCGYDGKVVRVYHRDNTPDRAVLAQVFSLRHYDIPGCFLPAIANYHSRIIASGRSALIVDAGANIGATALWFGLKWPPCRVVGLEPDRDNFEILVSNVNRTHLDAHLYHAGIDNRDGQGVLLDPGRGEWAYQTQRKGIGTPVRMIGVKRILTENAEYVPFILKVSIEGYEKLLFAGDTTAIDEFAVVIIKLHDWMLPSEGISLPFFRWHATHGRVAFHQENLVSVDWAKLSGARVLRS